MTGGRRTAGGRGLALLLAAGLLLALLGGCGMTTLNAAGYVRGLLDETYKGEYDEAYLALVGLTEEEAAADYQAGLEAEYTRFAEYFLLDSALSRETRAAFVEYLGQLYSQARYSVDCATRSDSGAWLVEVTVQPLLTLAALAARVPGLRADFDAQPLPEDTGREAAWAALVLEACRSAETAYGEEITLAVRLTADEEGLYSIGTRDFYNLDSLILPYDWEE